MSADNNIFSPNFYHAVRKPVKEASTLPSHCYTSELFFNREIAQVFNKQWQFVCREEQIKNTGEYFCFDGIQGSFIVIRDKNMEVKAYVNSCRHRGSRLLSGQGQCRQFVCPYHSWTYQLDGQLTGTPGMHDINQFNKEDYPMLEVAIAIWRGFVFINADQNPVSIKEYMGNFDSCFASHKPDKLEYVGSLEFTVNSNWKLLAENALEAYHTGSVHRETLGQQKSRELKCKGNWTGLLVEDELSVATMRGDSKPFDHISGLDSKAKEGAFFTLLYPSTQFVFAQDCIWWLSFIPKTVSQTELRLGYCFPTDTIAREDFTEQLERYCERWRSATVEDNNICEEQQKGQINERAPGRFATSEFAVHAFNNWILDHLLK